MRTILLILGLLVAIGGVGIYFVLLVGPLSDEGPTVKEGEVVVIEMTTKQWRFDVLSVKPSGAGEFSSTPPSGPFANTKITVYKGDTIVLRIKNLDVPHGFALEEFGVNTITPPGDTTEVRFVATQAGNFTFFCTVFCGTGHPNHKGTLIVEG